MTTSRNANSAPDPMDERSVLDYLQQHPDIFVRHPTISEKLRVPHGCGDAVSLIEYQVSVLQDRNKELRRRIHELARHARENEELGRRIHQLTLSLIDCASVDEIFTRLYQALHDDFQADFAAIRLFAVPRLESDRGLAEFVGAGAAELEHFSRVLADNKPICGRLKKDQLQCLLGERSTQVGSGALVPLGQSDRFGVLAICSRDPRRYYPGMGTVFLRQLGETVGHVIAPYRARN